jgi:hypothetical protein
MGAVRGKEEEGEEEEMRTSGKGLKQRTHTKGARNW